MSFTLDIKVKNLFFDRAVIKKMLGENERKGLSRIGSFLRTGMRSSLRRRKRVSRPGEAPSVHANGPASLKTILFAYEPSRHGVVVGPVRLNTRANLLLGGSTTVPELLEEGGTASIREKQIGFRKGDEWITAWVPQGRRVRPGQKTRRRRAVYQPRPFAGPALAKEIGKGTIPSIFTARAG